MDVLDAGYNPYLKDNSHVRRNLMGEPKVIIKEQPKQVAVVPKEQLKPVKVVEKEKVIVLPKQELGTITTLEDAKKIVLDTKEKVLNENSFPKYRSRINQFYRWLYENDFKETDSIETITKKAVIQYLNYVLQNTSARNRNNTRTDLSSFVGR